MPELVRGAADRGDEIIITRKGRPAAVLLSVEELEGLRETLEIMSDPKLMAQIRRGEEYFRKGGKGYTIEEAFGS